MSGAKATMPTSSSSATNNPVLPAFEAYYLQRATQELAEDLDKIRSADDFRNDAVPMLVHALKQGAAMFPPADQRRVAGSAEGSRS